MPVMELFVTANGVD